jgi:hypothetical protein
MSFNAHRIHGTGSKEIYPARPDDLLCWLMCTRAGSCS